MADNRIDIDGGIGTMFVIASKGRREMPDGDVYLDGGLEMLSREGQLRGAAYLHAAARGCGPYQRVQLPRLGDAGETRADAVWRGCPRS
jgi:hypothetical protein